MSVLSAPKSERRLRRLRFKRFMFWSGLILLVFISYQLGKMHSNAVKTTESHMIENLTAAKADLEKQVVSLKADLLTTQNKLDDLTQQYNADVDDKNLMTLNRLIHQKLDSGVTMERLQQVIAATSNVRNCSSPDTKRFIVTTDAPVKGAAGKVSFGSGLIVITAAGTAEVNNKGGHETWYDPKQPVDVTIAVKGADAVHEQGTMPIHHSIIHGDTEFQLTIAPGTRSYAEVTAVQCAYP